MPDGAPTTVPSDNDRSTPPTARFAVELGHVGTGHAFGRREQRPGAMTIRLGAQRLVRKRGEQGAAGFMA